jgi:hypothetical protein
MKMKNIITGTVISCITCFALAGCAKLDEKLYGSRSLDNGSVGAADLGAVYNQLNGQAGVANTFAMQEHSTDEMMGPTRGTDWGDFGTWRKLHTHTWTASHNQINDAWDELNIGVYRATQVVDKAADNQAKAEARFLRAYFMFQIVDLYGQQPLRDPNAPVTSVPTVMSRTETTDYIIKDLEFAETNLPQSSANIGKANKAAAQALLAKVYLNKAVYTSSNVGGPFTFAPADMNKVIEYANKVIAAGYTLAPAGKYFQDFAWDNSQQSHGNIFGIYNDAATNNIPSSVQGRWTMETHYNQTPNGNNGFTTLKDFYDSFQASDERRGVAYPGLTDIVGLRAGFLVGQQYGPGNKVLTQRSGKPLIFTPEVNLNYSTEAQGIRIIKYLPHPNPDGTITNGKEDNDYVILRVADVLLMKAEAIMRGGTDPNGQTPLAIVNAIRTPRGGTPLAAVTEADLLAERGRELYWEGWRRNDLIRFGKFNDPVDQRPNASDKNRTLYPIPQRAIDSNPNLKQNPGY